MGDIKKVTTIDPCMKKGMARVATKVRTELLVLWKTTELLTTFVCEIRYIYLIKVRLSNIIFHIQTIKYKSETNILYNHKISI